MPKPDALLAFGERKSSILPELVGFFEEVTPGQGIAIAGRFLQRFSGAHIKVPPPTMVEQLKRELRAAEELEHDTSATNRIRVCLAASISHAHLAEIYHAFNDRQLEKLDRGSRSQVIEQAAAHIDANRKNRRAMQIIGEMFSLTDKERKAVRDKLQ